MTRGQAYMRRFAAHTLVPALLLALAAPAAADLYRWRDPETGTIKISNIPPRWYGKGGGPRVEVIASGVPADRAAGAAPGSGLANVPLPAPRIVTPPPDATKEQWVQAVLEGAQLREQLSGWADQFARGVTDQCRERRVPQGSCDTLRSIARTAFGAERLYGHFVSAFSQEVTIDDLRAAAEADQLPLVRRSNVVADARRRAWTGVPAGGAPVTPARRTLAEEFERAVGGTEIMMSVVAGAMVAIAFNAPDESRTRFAEQYQAMRSELEPRMRARFVDYVLFVFEPLTDDELKALAEIQRRPGMSRVSRAVGLGLGAMTEASLAEFIAGAKPVVQALR
jgi:hypothetical protein